MNIIGKIYKTTNVLKLKDGFLVELKMKSNFGGITMYQLTALITDNKIDINLNGDLLFENNLCYKEFENGINFNEYKSDIDLKNYVLVKPDAYNLKRKKIKFSSEVFRGINIPIILSNKKSEEENILSIIRLTPFILDKKEYIKVDIEGDKLPIKFKTNKNIKFI